jgi:DedD protein
MKTYDESDDLHSDTEITLGLRSILGIFFGLALICGVFFGFGYSVGRGNTGKATPSGQTGAHVLGSTPPSPVRTVVEGAAPSDTDASDDSQYTNAAGSDGAPRKSAGIELQPKPSAASASAVPPVTETAENASGNAGSTGDTSKASASTPRPLAATLSTSALASANPSSTIMVQIAAVSHRQDADVLISALKKLGYDASVQTEASDNLLHVQVGPFATRDQAKLMRTKLLNDGYNAIVK